MGYSIGFSKTDQRYIGYGVIAICDHPDCENVIDRGMGYACCGGVQHHGNCTGYFCADHIENYYYFDELADLSPEELEQMGLDPDELEPEDMDSLIFKCKHQIGEGKEAVDWLNFMLTDDSWSQWREVNPSYVEQYKKLIEENAGRKTYVLVQKLEQPMND